jgi:hypothetical protein
MSRYNLRPNLLEDTLQEFELVRLQDVEWRRLKKRHRTSVQYVGQRVDDFKHARWLGVPSVAAFSDSSGGPGFSQLRGRWTN